NSVPRWLVWSGKTISCRRASMGALAVGGGRSERGIEGHLSLYPHLVGRDTALEEVGQFLHVLQFHEGQRIGHLVFPFHSEPGEVVVRTVLQVLAHVAGGDARNASGKHVLREV